jgi:hypothetical protein
VFEFFGEALSAIPTNPIALIAFLALVVGFVILAWQTQRNKEFSKDLKGLTEEERRKLLREKYRVEKLPAKMTVNGYLKMKRQTYTFFGSLAFFVFIIILVAIVVSPKDNGTGGSTTPESAIPTPLPVSGMVERSTVIPLVTLNDFLVNIREVSAADPKLKPINDSGAGKVLGAAIYATVKVEHIQGKECKVKGFMQKSSNSNYVSPPSGLDLHGLSDKIFLAQSGASPVHEIWVPYPNLSGSFVVMTELYCDTRLAYKLSDPFLIELDMPSTPTIQAGTPTVPGGTPTILGINPTVLNATPSGTVIKFKPVNIDLGSRGTPIKIPVDFYDRFGSDR